MRARPVYQHVARKTRIWHWAFTDWIAITASVAVALLLLSRLALPLRVELPLFVALVAPAVTMAEMRDQTGGAPGRWARAQVWAVIRPHRGVGGAPGTVRRWHGHRVIGEPPPPEVRPASRGSLPVELFDPPAGSEPAAGLLETRDRGCRA